MSERLTPARSELILGGQKSGKSNRAERLAKAWLAQSPAHRAVLIATGQPGDDEMRERIRRHQQQRAQRVPRLQTVEEPLALASAMAQHGGERTLLVIDCLTLWLTNVLMPLQAHAGGADHTPDALADAIGRCPGPVVLVSNEIGLGVIPLGHEVRAFVDALGGLNQRIASVCERVTFMAAGQALVMKGRA